MASNGYLLDQAERLLLENVVSLSPDSNYDLANAKTATAIALVSLVTAKVLIEEN